MHRYIRLMLTSLAAAAALAAIVSNASARNLEVSNQRIRVTWRELELFNNINSTTVRCPVTLEGSFHTRTIAKSIGSLVGFVTRAQVNNSGCVNGRATILTESLPWHLTYQGFTGTLPTILTIRLNLIRAAFQIEDGSNVCLAVTTAEEPATGIAAIGAGGTVTSLSPDEARRIRLRNGAGGIFCGLGSGSFKGAGNVFLLETTNSISIRLI